MSGSELEQARGREVERVSPFARRAQELGKLTVPENTSRAYQREWAKWLDWCIAQGVEPYPADSDALTVWVAERCAAGNSESIIKQGIAAVMHEHKMDKKLPKSKYPDTAGAWAVVRKYRTMLVESGWRPDEAAAFTVGELRAMCAALPEGKLSTFQARAVLTAGTPLFARRSMLVAIDVEDVTFAENGNVRVFVSKAKEDQWARGRKVPVPAGSHPMSDPVGALAEWVGVLRAHGMAEGPLFRRLALGKEGERLSWHRMHPAYVGKIVKRAAKAAGLQAPSGRTYRAHSLRASGATIAFDARRPAVQIARDGGWSEKGNQVHTYNRPETHDSAMEGLL